jgi:hypothetical protein
MCEYSTSENLGLVRIKRARPGTSFASLGSAERFSRLLVGCYRLKRFTDSCRRDDDGNSPLQMAGVDTEGIDWLVFLLRRCRVGNTQLDAAQFCGVGGPTRTISTWVLRGELVLAA